VRRAKSERSRDGHLALLAEHSIDGLMNRGRKVGNRGPRDPLKGKMGDTSRSQTISTKLRWIGKQAGDYPEMVFTTLAHHMDVDLLREAYRHTRNDSSPGIDGVTAKHYGENLEGNLRDLHGLGRGSS
jgi:hypothetical protein